MNSTHMNNRALFVAGLTGLLCIAVLHRPPNLAADVPLTADEIISHVDRNQYIGQGTVEARMRVKGGAWQQIKLFTITRDNSSVRIEFSNPHDEGTSMQYSNGRLQIFYPDVRRPVELTGRMLNMAFMGSDFSYMDVIQPYSYGQLFSFEIVSTQQLGESATYLLRGTPRSGIDHSPQQISLWVDAEQFVVVRQESRNPNSASQAIATTESITEFQPYILPARRVLQRQLQPDTYSILEIIRVNTAE